MLARSDEFDRALPYTARMVTRVDVLRGGQPVQLGQRYPAGLPVASFSIPHDRSQLVRRTLSELTIIDPSFIAEGSPVDAVSPFSTELRVFFGLQLPSGAEELLPVGTFQVYNATDDLPFQGIKITGSDRMQRVIDTDFPKPLTLPAGSALSTLRQLLLEAVPWAPFVVDPRVRDIDSPAVPVTDGNRGKAVATLAETLAAEVYADPWGQFVIRPTPSVTDTPVWTFRDGIGGTLQSTTRTLSRDGAFNGVIAKSTAGNVAATSDLIVDDDPFSPTWWGNDGEPQTQLFGRITVDFDTPWAVTVFDLNAAAAGILRDSRGAAKSLKFDGIWHPALEPGDCVMCSFGGRNEQHLLESWTLSTSGTVQASTRTPTLNSSRP